ncbi:MAG: diguanylate cyclase [Chitinispirillaceae bacterium]|jgi:diguanylate cyclase (GGDEF)-like protein|nr:diguanylate cyclase [Chitinispirillaceae bacterium]
MTVRPAFSFEGYQELILKPFEKSDPKSLGTIHRLLHTFPAPHSNPFGYLIKSLSDTTISRQESRGHWKSILEHKRNLESTLARTVHIRTATVDYYDLLGIMTDSVHDLLPEKSPDQQTLAADPEYHLERLKKEMMRAKRYKHALSVIMVKVNQQAIVELPAAEKTRDAVMSIIVKVIDKAVRTVDILARHTDSMFLLILPNTNKREAVELAGRLRNGIRQRTARLPELSDNMPVAFAVGQCVKEDSSIDFIRRLENLVNGENPAEINEVHTL